MAKSNEVYYEIQSKRYPEKGNRIVSLEEWSKMEKNGTAHNFNVLNKSAKAPTSKNDEPEMPKEVAEKLNKNKR